MKHCSLGQSISTLFHLFRGHKPLTRTFFLTKSQNSGEQSVYFIALASWLVGLCGGKMSGDKKYDDPVTMASNLLTEMKKIGIDCQVAPNLLRSGYGLPICTVLLLLVDKALEVKKFEFVTSKIEESRKTNRNDTPEIEDEAPDLINIEIDYGDNLDAEKKDHHKQIDRQKEEEDNGTGILFSGTSNEEWQRELEKLSSQLRLDYDSMNSYGNSEWRTHIETIKKNEKSFNQEIPETRAVLENLSAVIDRTLEKITKKEQMISKNHSNIISSYKEKHNVKNSQFDEYKKLGENVDNLKTRLDELNDKLSVANEKYERLTNVVSDTSALGNMKQSIQKLQGETLTLDMKINILNHSYLKYLHEVDSLKGSGADALNDSNMYEEVF